MMIYIQQYENFIQPSHRIKNKIDTIVNDLLVTYGGGRPFFDALDDQIKNIINSDLIVELLRGNVNNYIVSSGGFGDIVYDLYEQGRIECKGVLIFNGKIHTKKRGVTYYYPYEFDINNKRFIFTDDSLFSGKTYREIDQFLSKYNSRIVSINVIYDGSKMKSPMVNSLYRYHK